MNEKQMSWSRVSSPHVLFMKFIGLVPFDGRNFESTASRFCSLLCHLMNITYNCMWTGYGIRRFPEIFVEVDYMCELIVVQGVFFRYLALYAERAKITNLVLHCQKLWTRYIRGVDDEFTVRQFERRAFYLRAVLLGDGLLMVSLYIASSLLLEMPVYQAHNLTKPLMFKYWTTVEDDTSWNLVTLWQCILVYYITLEISSLDAVHLFLAMTASGYLKVLQERLLNIERSTRPHDDLLQCFKYHQEIMRLCKGIELVMRKAFLVIVLTSCYNLSITGIRLLDEDEILRVVTYSTLLLLNLFQLFCAQYAPEHLLTESEAIGDAVYSASMRNLGSRTNKMLLFMMMRTQRPVQLTAGGFINLSIETFGKMLKSAFQFFTLLRSLHD